MMKFLSEQLIATVSGGLIVYVNKFFAEKGVHPLNSENDQYSELLQLFLSLDKLFKAMQ